MATQRSRPIIVVVVLSGARVRHRVRWRWVTWLEYSTSSSEVSPSQWSLHSQNTRPNCAQTTKRLLAHFWLLICFLIYLRSSV